MFSKDDELLEKYPRAMEADANSLFDRSRSSMEELAKLVLAMSVGAIGIIFLSLTNTQSALNTPLQETLLFVAIVLMGLATLLGMIAWYLDFLTYHHWASACNADEDNGLRNKHISKCDLCRFLKNNVFRLQMLSFIFGITCVSVFLLFRIHGI